MLLKATKIRPDHALIALISIFLLFCVPATAEDSVKEEAVKLEEGETTPYSGYLITEEQFNTCLQTTIDLEDAKGLIQAKSDLIETYEKKDIAVKKLKEVTDDLADILDYYKKITKDLIDLKKPKSKFKFGIYAGVNSLTLDNKVGAGYNIGIFIGF